MDKKLDNLDKEKPNKENLKFFTTENASEYGRKGGIKSGESRRKRNQIRDTLEIMLSQKIKDPDVKKSLKNMGFGSCPTYQDYLVCCVVQRTADKGTIVDLENLVEILGENSTDGTEDLTLAIKLLDGVPSVID